jgi:ankyrin repeat protein
MHAVYQYCQQNESWDLLNGKANERAALIETLVSLGADVNHCTSSRRTPLLEICQLPSSAFSITRSLIEHGAEFNYQDQIGGPPLWWAAHNGNLAGVLYLLLRGKCHNIKEDRQHENKKNRDQVL